MTEHLLGKITTQASTYLFTARRPWTHEGGRPLRWYVVAPRRVETSGCQWPPGVGSAVQCSARNFARSAPQSSPHQKPNVENRRREEAHTAQPKPLNDFSLSRAESLPAAATRNSALQYRLPPNACAAHPRTHSHTRSSSWLRKSTGSSSSRLARPATVGARQSPATPL